jgi:hypothetical protein
MKKFLPVFLILIASYIGALSIIPTTWNLGSITSNSGIQILEMEVHNDTTEKIKVDLLSTCDCLTSDTNSLTMAPDESSLVVLSFDPIEESGAVSKFMIIRTTQPDLPKALFEVIGEVTGNENTLQDNNSQTELNSTKDNSDYLQNDNEVINMKYYYSAGCVSCRRFLDLTIPRLETKLGVTIEIEPLNIMDSKIYEDYFSLITEEEKNTAAFPSLFMEDKLFQGDKEILKNLEQAIVDYKGADVRTSSTGSIGAVSISLIPVFLAGLLDGINPCVFSTLLFLISSLTLAGRKRKEIFIIGIFFTITVFITYYLVGLGLFQGLRTASVFPFIADIIKYILIFFLILISVLSLYDFVQIKKGRAAKISLQLPKFLKLKIHGVIREQSKSSSIIIGALVLGVMVSVFELACTGQVYFPTIAYLVKLGQSSAYFYLLIYNISFIIPLFIVFVLIYKGTGSKAITGFFQNNMGLMKISLSLLFFILAGVVFLS